MSMKTLELAIPPPIVMLVIGLLMWLLAIIFPSLSLPSNSSAGAVALGLLGLAISIAGVITFRRAGTTTDPRNPAESSALVVSGIYRLTRNPMYLGVLLILMAWGLWLGNVLALICAFVFVPYINRYQIQPEEQLLQDKFGTEFASYKARVRRWI